MLDHAHLDAWSVGCDTGRCSQPFTSIKSVRCSTSPCPLTIRAPGDHRAEKSTLYDINHFEYLALPRGQIMITGSGDAGC